MALEMLYSYWSGDVSPRGDRIECVLREVERIFPDATTWNARPHGHSPREKRITWSDEQQCREMGGTLSKLWATTVKHFRQAHDVSPNDLVIECTAYSEVLGLGVQVYCNEQQLMIDNEGRHMKVLLTQYFHDFENILKAIGSCKSFGGCWLRKHSAFAGNPVYLYEPRQLFAKLYDALQYDTVVDEVHAVRDAVSSVLDLDTAFAILTKLDCEPQRISDDRLFVRFGDPLKGVKRGVFAELAKQIGEMLP